MELFTGELVTKVVKTAVGTAVPSLVKLIKYEWGLDKSVTDGLKSLRDELRSMQAFVEYVSGVPPDQLDLQVNIRGSEVRELLSAIETSLYSFMGDIESTKGALIPALNKQLINHKIDKYIKETRVKVKELHARHGPYPSRSYLESTSTQRVDPYVVAMYTKEPNPEGIEGPIEELTKMLSRSNHVSIVGMTGLGKTTLARAVYGKMKGQFDCGAFVGVCKRADSTKVPTDIFSGLYMDKYGKEPHLSQQNDQLQDFLVDHRSLIVIDDICEEGTWNLLESIFTVSPGSKVITTTRKRKIAQEVGGVYEMKPLSLYFSKRLLSIKAEADIHDTKFGEISDKIFHKCGGVPIAINAIGRFLAKNKSKGWDRAYDSIGFDEHMKDGAFEHIKTALSRSYFALPPHLQKCFLYLSLFPEDHWIEKNMLIWRWVTEDLVDCNEERSFRLGETYFHELIDRCMIQWAVSPRDIGQGGCRVHSLMFELICDLSSSQTTNFSTVLGRKQDSTSQTSTIHRLAIHKASLDRIQNTSSLPKKNPNTSLEVGRVLSFYASTCPGSSLPDFSKFELLRVIDLECCELSVGDKKLKNLGKLSQLRYVGLLGTPVAELPKKIRRLKFLETLDMTGTGIKELPAFVCELKKLRCLRAGKGTRMMGRVGELTSLEELWLHSADKSPDFAAELRKLTELRVLVVHFDEIVEDMQEELVESLSILKKLQVLQVWSDAEGKVCPVGWEGSVPSRELRQLLLFGVILPKPMPWIHHLCAPKLSKLLLQVEILKVQDLEILGKLPSLRSLYLYIHSVEYTRVSYTASKDEFKVLEYFNTNIELICGDGALPVIQELEVAGIMVGTDVGLLGNMPLLERASYHLDCSNNGLIVIEMAEEALRKASQVHPNRPTLSIKRFNDFNIPFEVKDQMIESVVTELVTRLVALTFSDTGSKAEASDSSETSFFVNLYSDYLVQNMAGGEAPPTLAVDDVTDGSTSLSTKRKGSTMAYFNSLSAADQAEIKRNTDKLFTQNPEFIAAMNMELDADGSISASARAKMMHIITRETISRELQKVGEPGRVSETSARASTDATEGLMNESSECGDDSMLDRFDSLIAETAKFAALSGLAADADFRKWLKQSMHNPEFVASVKSFREGGLQPSSSQMSQLVKLVTADFMSLRAQERHGFVMRVTGDYTMEDFTDFMAQEKDRLGRGQGAETGTGLWLKNRDGSEVSSEQIHQFFGNREMLDRATCFMDAGRDNMVRAMGAGAEANLEAQFNAVLWLNSQDEADFSLEQLDQLPQKPEKIARTNSFWDATVNSYATMVRAAETEGIVRGQGAEANFAEKHPGENSGASVSCKPTPKGVDAALRSSQQTDGQGRFQGAEANLAQKHPAENSGASSSAEQRPKIPCMPIQLETWFKSPEGADLFSKTVHQLFQNPEIIASMNNMAQNGDFGSMPPGLLDNPEFRNLLENFISQPSFTDAAISGFVAQGVDAAAESSQQTDGPGRFQGAEANLAENPAENSGACASGDQTPKIPCMQCVLESVLRWLSTPDGADFSSKVADQFSRYPEMIDSLNSAAQNDTLPNLHNNPAFGNLMANLASQPSFMDVVARSYATMAQGVAQGAESSQYGEIVSRMLKKVLPAVEQKLAAGASSGQPSSPQPDNAGKKAPARK